MAGMRLTVIGCAGSFPGPDSPASCYLLEAEGFRLVIDMGYGVARQFAPDGARPPIPVYGPPGTAARVTPHLGPSDHPAAEPEPPRFDFHDLAVSTAEIGPFRISTDHMNHPVETFGFGVEQDGWRLAYSADTGESDALVRLAEGADLLLCEASFLDGQDTRPN